MTSKVYMITHCPSYKKYIGITSISIEKRWVNHVNAARRGCIQLLHAAIRTHGAGAFIVDLLLAEIRAEKKPQEILWKPTQIAHGF